MSTVLKYSITAVGGSSSWRDFDRPADCIQLYSVAWLYYTLKASFLTVAYRYALTKLSVRACKTNNCRSAITEN